MNLADVAWAGLGGGVGASARYGLDRRVSARWPGDVPVGTVAINLTGSLVLGVLAGLVSFHHVSSALTVVGGTGFCGGYTTFSTANVEVVRLWQRARLRVALAVLAVTLAGAIGAAALGLAVASI